MVKKLSDDEVTDLIHAMGEMMFPGGEKVEAETPYGQARLETALRILVIAAARQQPKKPPELTVVDGGKA